MSKSTKRNIAQLLASGMPATDVARKVSVTPSYISQLLQDDEFQRIYNEMTAATRIQNHSRAAAIDAHYDNLEHRIINFLDEESETLLPELAKKPMQLVKTLQVLNGAKRRSSGEGAPQQANTVAELVLPSFIIAASQPKVTKNSNNEVVEVDGRVLISLQDKAGRKQLARLSEEIKQEKKEEKATKLIDPDAL